MQSANSERSGYMLDTNIFNKVVDGKLSTAVLDAHRVFATHVQLNELQATTNPDRRAELLAAFDAINAHSVATGGAIWDVSKWDQACWSSEDGSLDALLQRVTELDEASRKRTQLVNRQRDALIAITAIEHKLTLITNDVNLAKAVGEFGGHAISLSDLARL